MSRALLVSLALFTAACGGEDVAPDASPPDVDAAVVPPDAEEPLPPVCTGDAGSAVTYTYVIDSIDIPEDSAKNEDLGMDLDGDGTVDNQLGNILSALFQAGGGVLDSQADVTTSVDHGATLLLAVLEPCSGETQVFATYSGANPSPAACSGPTDTTCRHHLDGNGAFDIAAGSPVDRATVGELEGDTFYGTGGELVLQLSLAGGEPIELELVAARVAIDSPTAAGFGASVIAGGIPEAQITARVIPGVHGGIASTIAADCTGTGDMCGCTPDSSGLTMLGIFDENEDCAVTLEEVQSNSLIVTLFRPDLDTDGDDVNDALSLGVGVTAVAATFTFPLLP